MLAVGPGSSKRPTGWPLNDVWTASDPALRYVAPVDRPRNGTFVVWRLSSSLMIFSVAVSWNLSGGATLADAARHTAYLAVGLAVITVVFAVVTTVAVRAITRRQTNPVMFRVHVPL